MCSLHGFPAVPPQGHVSLCEVEGRVYSMPAEQANVHTFTTAVSIIFFIGIFLLLMDLQTAFCNCMKQLHDLFD
jgi:hypothetical protein